MQIPFRGRFWCKAAWYCVESCLDRYYGEHLPMTTRPTSSEIAHAITSKSEVAVYFKDSDIPAYVVATNGGSLYIRHGSRNFWIRINSKNVERIVVE